MKLCILGCGSSYPTPLRGSSSLGLILEDGSVWLFDCGEGTQIQVQKTSFTLHRLRKIFITHLHGDHLFGLPGLLCSKSIGSNIPISETPIVEIYGPTGLQKYLYHSLSLSRSPLCYRYAVYELEPVKYQYPDDWEEWKVDHDRLHIKHPAEVDGGIIKATEDSEGHHTWHLFDNETVTVTAGVILHRIPCFGFVIKEKNKPGSLQVEKLKKLGLQPGPKYGILKNGNNVEFNGKVIESSDVLGLPIPGRTLVILGDTNDASGISHLFRDCDILIHESTHDNSLAEKAFIYGHSTPSGAVSIAQKIGAKMLILNHFSQRYRDKSEKKEETVDFLKEQALQCLTDDKISIIMAKDLMTFDIPVKRPIN